MSDNRDYTLIIDKSGSMMTSDGGGSQTRWSLAEESTFALAAKCEQLDPDGITVYLFSGRFQRYENVTAAKVAQIFQENDPSGRTDLASVLKDAVEHYFKKKGSGEVKSGETILVITDGEPDDRKAVMRVIVEATRQMERDEELAISMIQVGSDSQATRFLKALDDELGGVGAKFDIVDTITIDDMEDYTLSEVLLKAIGD
ncbi:vWA domain-containing protein [Laspinema olomoucense]|uniref:VWA domain-containing protein n=1 Tax=Laspinema olomoucense D3b TaxID=2953688 RepID=A0ABT2N6Q7_9CYAN|nr:VWA domain-containing protein [Laspinema sp. D3b]MCT7978357.1 VWA domain-containing protein [Laspinema sp. D3b]